MRESNTLQGKRCVPLANCLAELPDWTHQHRRAVRASATSSSRGPPSTIALLLPRPPISSCDGCARSTACLFEFALCARLRCIAHFLTLAAAAAFSALPTQQRDGLKRETLIGSSRQKIALVWRFQIRFFQRCPFIQLVQSEQKELSKFEQSFKFERICEDWFCEHQDQHNYASQSSI